MVNISVLELLENTITVLTPYQKDILLKRMLLADIKKEANCLDKMLIEDYRETENNSVYRKV